jgi:hypothetical protein
LESNTSPVLWEVTVKEQGAHVIAPVLVAHQESTIIGVDVESLIFRKGFDVSFDHLSILFDLCRVLTPSSKPFAVTPWVSESKESKLILSVAWIFKLHDIVDAVGVVEDETCRLTIDNKRSLLAVTLDATAQEAAVGISGQKEVPKSFLSAIVLLDHFVRE